MLNPKITTSFKKDVKTVEKRNKDMSKLKDVIDKLINEIPLELQYKDHPLTGNYKGDRECHIEPDWLLIYTIIDKDIYFARTGSHSDLF